MTNWWLLPFAWGMLFGFAGSSSVFWFITWKRIMELEKVKEHLLSLSRELDKRQLHLNTKLSRALREID